MENTTQYRDAGKALPTALHRSTARLKTVGTAIGLVYLLGLSSLAGQAVLPVDNTAPAAHTLTAIIAWNGQEEILLMSSFFESDVPSAVHLSVVPSRPEPMVVSSGDLEGIGKLVLTYFVEKRAGRLPAEVYEKAAVFPQVTVARDLPEVVNLTSERDLLSWLDDSNKVAGYRESKLPGDLRRGLNRAIRANGEWTLASRIGDISSGTGTAWTGGKFSTKQPYFPLHLLAGQPDAKAKFFVLTPSYPTYEADVLPYITELAGELPILQRDLAAASPLIGEHFEGQTRVTIRTIEITNLPRSFNFGLFAE